MEERFGFWVQNCCICCKKNSQYFDACLPSESKDLLHNQGFILSATSEPLLFNYATFCKELSVEKITKMVESFLDINHKYLVILISSMLMKQFSWKKLTWYKKP